MTTGTAALMKGQQWARSQQAWTSARSVQCDNIVAVKSPCSRRIHTKGALWKEHENNSGSTARVAPIVREKIADRDFYLSVLSSTSTKREASPYLSKFMPSKKSQSKSRKGQSASAASSKGSKHREQPLVKRAGVNLGNLYMPIKAVEDSPVFSQYPTSENKPASEKEPLHVALVKIRLPSHISASTLEGVGLTLSQLGRLGLSTVVVIDTGIQQGGDSNHTAWRSELHEAADRMVTAIEKYAGPGARRLDNVIGISSTIDQSSSRFSIRRAVRVAHRESLLAPLRRGITPVIAPVGYSAETQKAAPVDANDVVLALTREFAGILTSPAAEEDPVRLRQKIADLQKHVSLERLIILDPLGGIPGRYSSSRSHVFINLEQEFDEIKNELLNSKDNNEPDGALLEPNGGTDHSVVNIGKEISSKPGRTEDRARSKEQRAQHQSTTQHHLNNLKLLQRTLALLPPSSSALLTTPYEAANAGRSSHNAFVAADVGTRRQKNPLIHNLLTDKPLFSSSLPSGRLGPPQIAQSDHGEPIATRTAATPTTFVKRGMPLTMLPDPRLSPWTPPKPGERTLSLNDPRIDLPRLINLIEDSFNRKLDVENYLARIQDRIAGVIIAGEYEGGALLTWETPPQPRSKTGEASSPATTLLPRTIPYLDKFAVLKRSQGAGGVADIVFNAMVRTCLPNGVCWRSRRDNPVNKWYFERARGTWKIPDSNWTMFWTTEDVAVSGERVHTFLEYEDVCRGVVPSWADMSKAAD
ncbi:MAG: hypothetical protein M4579_001254 [Chaenotheca gracillima]|nr:MAG: hypothetical protein M4579_001254 [Chaenotheca gracillima]